MGKLKELKFPTIQLDERNDNRRIHFDYVDDLYAKKHYGEYIIVKHSEAENISTSRVYLSNDAQVEYYLGRKKRGDKLFNCVPAVGKVNLFDLFPQYKTFIKSTISYIIQDRQHSSTVMHYLIGFNIFLSALKSHDIVINEFKEITNEHHALTYNYIKVTEGTNNYTMRNVRSFFGVVELNLEHFITTRIPRLGIDNSILALSSTVSFQISYFSEVEISKIIKRVNEYKEWMKEYENIELFSLKNLAKTYYESQGSTEKRPFGVTVNSICIDLHGINLKYWIRRSRREYVYKNLYQKKMHEEMLEYCKDGTNIDVVDEKMYAFWHKEIYPDWPFTRTLAKKFDSSQIKYFRYRYAEKLGIDLNNFDSRIYPSGAEIYPLILLLLIWEGMNTEVLKNWRVKKNKKGEFKIGNETSIGLLIESTKARSNSIQANVLSNSSNFKKYIDFYLKWLTPIYENSGKDNFFQYIYLKDKEEPLRIWKSSAFFNNLKHSKDSLFAKYEILETSGTKVQYIDHRRIRPYTNYRDAMADYSEFKRQMKKGHENIDTLKHYENSKEWIGDKKHRIARTQNLIVKILRDDEDKYEEKIQNLFNGPLADCEDPKKPDHPDALTLKKNEICSDWFKCLTMCGKANVVPKVHGPVIYAWILYMEEEYENYFSYADWEKEYSMDYMAAVNTFGGFTFHEKNYSEENAYKHEEFVKRKFKRKMKIRA
ncbi:hypothetical protein MN086_03225 [Sulfurovum sp. XGS-02]|uniref:hypothetical protein n=1 Tax=Sulfurovum sp. XGS-02 TaxID=2925411 RepID=UPI00205A5AFF|nr:hypothetical protein [Sulfurovum sp. XGS-02]UPT78164.1 hypothetical protein MN086_03225 [Sulfurovum sp. XGS-02]